MGLAFGSCQTRVWRLVAVTPDMSSLREFVLIPVILTPGACGREGPGGNFLHRFVWIVMDWLDPVDLADSSLNGACHLFQDKCLWRVRRCITYTGMFSGTYPSLLGNDCAVQQEIVVRSGLDGSQTPKRQNILKNIKNSRSTALAANMLIATS